ncbi:MAG: AAA family ATPase [Opitutae bacterium]|nr:AAA family ATPase [Opitutae bacterium]MCD8298311.1 AAA family ATPase [Opitutae bacterium]
MSINKAAFAHDIPGFLTKPMNVSTKRIFVAATRQNDGKTTTSLGLFGALRSLGYEVGYIKPVAQRIVHVDGEIEVDEDTFLLDSVYDVKLPLEAMSPVAVDSKFTRTYLDDSGTMRPRIMDAICRAFDRAAYEKDIVIVEGSGHAGVGSVFETSNADNAAMLGSKAIIVASGGIGKPVDEIALNKALFDKKGVECVGVILNKILPGKLDEIRHYVGEALGRMGVPLLGVLPYDRVLELPNVSQIADEIGGRWIVPVSKLRSQRVAKFIIGAMSAQSVFEHIVENTLVIVPGDREDLLFSLIAGAGAGAGEMPQICGIVLTNNKLPSNRIVGMLSQMKIPVVATERECFDATRKINSMIVKTSPVDSDKISTIEKLIREHVDMKRLLSLI